jgi:U6 snRNA-associated Sm-like protein LSm8
MRKRVCATPPLTRALQGTLRGIDPTYNAILEGSHERVFSATAGVEQLPLGLYIIRGDNVAAVGEVDADVDARLDWNALTADPLGPIVH